MSTMHSHRYEQALLTISRPRVYDTMHEAMESLPEILRAAYADIADACEQVPLAPHLRGVLVDLTNWADLNHEPEYTGVYWLQWIANTHVRTTLHHEGNSLTGYRPLIRIEQVVVCDGVRRRAVVSVPTFGEVAP